MSGVPQFGEAIPGTVYRDRPSAFGVLVRDDGRIAVARITREDGSHDHDLPGGALDPGESEAEAMAREFREETGLSVEAGAEFARANQLVQNHTSGPVNNLCVFFEACETGPAGAVEEPDHELVWMAPEEAAQAMYKGAAGWAIRRWLAGREG